MKARIKGKQGDFSNVIGIMLEGDSDIYPPQFLEFLGDENIDSKEAAKLNWISNTAVKLLATIPYDFVIKNSSGESEPRHKYAARIAKEMADTIFG